MGLAGADVALETADIGLMAGEIERTPQVIAISHKALVAIRQNMIFSILLGGFRVIGPVVGAIMHELSALPALANSARIIQYQPEHSKEEKYG